MTKQTINLLGGLIVAVIVLAGLFLGALPRWQAAQDAAAERSTVESQNATQQQAIDGLARQADDLPRLRSKVAKLREQVPRKRDLEGVVELAVHASKQDAVLRSITEVAPEDQPQPAETPTPSASGTDPADAAPSNEFQEITVTIAIDLAKPGSMPRVLDALRDGPRRFAIDSATLAGGTDATDDKGAKYALSVTGRVFVSTEATS